MLRVVCCALAFLLACPTYAGVSVGAAGVGGGGTRPSLVRTNFYDNFDRADTSAGTIGTSTSGHVYDLRGPSQVSPSPYGQITSNRLVSNAGEVFYAMQTLSGFVRRMGATVSWVAGNGGTNRGAIVFGISPMGGVHFTHYNTHIVITPATWCVQFFEASLISACAASGSFSPELSYSTSYSFEIVINGTTMVGSFAGTNFILTDARVGSTNGRVATWEHFYQSASVQDLVRSERHWAETR